MECTVEVREEGDLRKYTVIPKGKPYSNGESTFWMLSYAISLYFLSTNVLFILSAALVLRYLMLRNRVVEGTLATCCEDITLVLESLTIIRESGVQIQTRYYNGKQSQLFIDRKRIKSVIINETISKFGVVFYMAFIVDKRSKMILGFQNIYPRIKLLLPIYRGTRSMLFGEPEFE